jgi:GntP family gluconate:H+ symporter
MDAQFTTIGALIGLAISIALIILKLAPAYSLILGALVGGLIGGGGLADTISTMISGAGSMMTSVLRILTSGILAGALIKTGSAQKIAETIVDKLGEKRAVIAIAIATMIICAVGVFIDISVITVAPIALAIGEKAKLSKSGVLLAMIGGGKAGNIISPNPNTIAVSEAFEQPLTSVMMKNALPALFALVVAILLASLLTKKKDDPITSSDLETVGEQNLPGFFSAILGPLVVILLLALRPIFGITIDPLIALPLGGIVCILVTGKARHLTEYTAFGMSKVIGVSILLIGTGTIAGIIKASALQYDVIQLLEKLHMPPFILAPLSGILMGGATASTTAGATVAAETFSGPLLSAGVPALAAAAMIHAGATVVDSLPHGSFFHATGGSVNMSISRRMKLIPYEALIGLTSTVAAVVIYLIAG